jgi:hypothetical protein
MKKNKNKSKASGLSKLAWQTHDPGCETKPS